MLRGMDYQETLVIADNLPKRHSSTALEHVGEVVSRTYTNLLTAIREEQARMGRHMTDSELDRFAREYYADEYRQDLRRIMAMGAKESDEEE